MATAKSSRWGDHDHSVLVLQGGGALGADQAGAYEGIANAGVELDWVFFAAFPTKALTGQSLIVSHGWSMQ